EARLKPCRNAAKGSRKNKLAFWRERRAGRCKAPRRRRCGDIVEERQRRRYAPWPPHSAGLRLPRPANHCGLPVMIQLGMGVAAKCQIILARALKAGLEAGQAGQTDSGSGAFAQHLAPEAEQLCRAS